MNVPTHTMITPPERFQGTVIHSFDNVAAAHRAATLATEACGAPWALVLDAAGNKVALHTARSITWGAASRPGFAARLALAVTGWVLL